MNFKSSELSKLIDGLTTRNNFIFPPKYHIFLPEQSANLHQPNQPNQGHDLNEVNDQKFYFSGIAMLMNTIPNRLGTISFKNEPFLSEVAT